MKTEDTIIKLRCSDQARSKPDTVNRPVRTAHTYVHHYNSTQYCSTEIVFFNISLPPDQHRISRFGQVEVREGGGVAATSKTK